MYTKPLRGARLNLFHPLARGLVGCWLFNEGCGDKAYDLSGYGNYGTLVNMLPSAPGSGWAGNKFGGGLDFDGVNDFVTPPLLSSYFTDTATVVFWLKLANDPPIDGTKVGLGFGGAGTNITHYPYTNGNLEISVFSNTRHIAAYNNTAFDKSKWHQLAITTTPGAGNYKLYQNGQFVTSGTGPATLSMGSGIYIGRNSNRYLEGFINSVYLYNRALSASEIQQLCMYPYAAVEPIGIGGMLSTEVATVPQTSNLATMQVLMR